MDDTKAETLGNFGKLEGLVAAVPERRPAPVESWHPPYCGDIGLKIRRDGTWLYRGSPIGGAAWSTFLPAYCARTRTGAPIS